MAQGTSGTKLVLPLRNLSFPGCVAVILLCRNQPPTQENGTTVFFGKKKQVRQGRLKVQEQKKEERSLTKTNAYEYDQNIIEDNNHTFKKNIRMQLDVNVKSRNMFTLWHEHATPHTLGFQNGNTYISNKGSGKISYWQ